METRAAARTTNAGKVRKTVRDIVDLLTGDPEGSPLPKKPTAPIDEDGRGHPSGRPAAVLRDVTLHPFGSREKVRSE
jgi:hypothetical protein